jgi:hypothetical protein
MEKQDFVLRWHPSAIVVEVPPILCGENVALLQPGYWIVYAGSDRDAEELGRGTTESGAWAAAASKLEAGDNARASAKAYQRVTESRSR